MVQISIGGITLEGLFSKHFLSSAYTSMQNIQKLTVDFKSSSITTGSLEDDFRLSKELEDDPSSYGSNDIGAAVACAGDAAIGQ